MKWYNPQNEPFLITGFPFYHIDHVYRRMPLSPSHKLPEAVDGLANETAGGQIRFHAKLKKLTLEVSRGSKPAYFKDVKSAHLSLATKASFDMYVSR